MNDKLNLIIESKVFIFLISFIFGVAIYKFYLYIKEHKDKRDFSDVLRIVVVDYIKTGKITVSEYAKLMQIMSHMGNYIGIYRQTVDRMIREFGENGNLNFDADFSEIEKEPSKEPPIQLDYLLEENLRLKRELSKRNEAIFIDKEV